MNVAPSTTYSANGDRVSRMVSLPDGRLRSDTLPVPPSADKTSDADALFDLAWLTSKTIPQPQNLRGEFRIVDLFCGCGGLTLGLREAAFVLGRGFRSVFV